MQQPIPVTKGSVVSTMYEELAMLFEELNSHRAFADELRAWFAEQPEASEAFGEFQAARKRRPRVKAKR